MAFSLNASQRTSFVVTVGYCDFISGWTPESRGKRLAVKSRLCFALFKGVISMVCNCISIPLKYHGGKHYQAQKIVQLMPPHLHYVEPYFGSGAVLFSKDPHGISEVANDLDERLVTF